MKTKQRDHSLLYTRWSSQLLSTADMTPLFTSLLLAAMCFECRAQKDNVLQPKEDVTAAEGEAVTLGCQYNSSSSPTLFWYKQEGNNSPKFILSRFAGNSGNTPDEFKERFSSTLNSTLRSVPLKIQKLQLSDSAVYYCALTGSTSQYKLIFGSGTRLTIEAREKYEPSFYKVGNNETQVCLATGFSRHNASEVSPFQGTKAVRISGDSLYNQAVVLSSGNEQHCAKLEDGSDSCEGNVETDPTMNLASLTVLGLRLLFIKTIVFNVLMTFRLWISQ